MARQFSNDFKLMIVELLDSGHSLQEVLQEYDLVDSVVRRWRKKYREDSSCFSAGKKNSLTKQELEVRQLRKKLKDVTMERDILKKVVRIFSVNDRKNTSL